MSAVAAERTLPVAPDLLPSAGRAPTPVAPAVAPPTPAAPGPLSLATGLSGYLVLGVVFAMGEASLVAPLRFVPTFFVGAVGGVAFTLPALLVLHGSLRLPARPAALLGALARALTDTGHVALASTPVALLFVAAGGVVPALHVLATAAIGLLGLWTGARALSAVDRGEATWPAHLGLIGSWVLVTGVVGVALILSWLELARGA